MGEDGPAYQYIKLERGLSRITRAHFTFLRASGLPKGVAPIFNRQAGSRVRIDSVPEIGRAAGSKTAIQQTKNMRYSAGKSEKSHMRPDYTTAMLLRTRQSLANRKHSRY